MSKLKNEFCELAYIISTLPDEEFDWVETQEDLEELSVREKHKYLTTLKLHRKAVRVCADVFTEGEIKQHHIDQLMEIKNQLLTIPTSS